MTNFVTTPPLHSDQQKYVIDLDLISPFRVDIINAWSINTKNIDVD